MLYRQEGIFQQAAHQCMCQVIRTQSSYIFIVKQCNQLQQKINTGQQQYMQSPYQYKQPQIYQFQSPFQQIQQEKQRGRSQHEKDFNSVPQLKVNSSLLMNQEKSHHYNIKSFKIGKVRKNEIDVRIMIKGINKSWHNRQFIKKSIYQFKSQKQQEQLRQQKLDEEAERRYQKQVREMQNQFQIAVAQSPEKNESIDKGKKEEESVVNYVTKLNRSNSFKQKSQNQNIFQQQPQIKTKQVKFQNDENEKIKQQATLDSVENTPFVNHKQLQFYEPKQEQFGDDFLKIRNKFKNMMDRSTIKLNDSIKSLSQEKIHNKSANLDQMDNRILSMLDEPVLQDQLMTEKQEENIIQEEPVVEAKKKFSLIKREKENMEEQKIEKQEEKVEEKVEGQQSEIQVQQSEVKLVDNSKQKLKKQVRSLIFTKEAQKLLIDVPKQEGPQSSIKRSPQKRLEIHIKKNSALPQTQNARKVNQQPQQSLYEIIDNIQQLLLNI